jgi:hypothetical protein
MRCASNAPMPIRMPMNSACRSRRCAGCRTRNGNVARHSTITLNG